MLMLCLLLQAQPQPTAEDVIRHATSFLGTRYVWGSCEVPPGFDCSGFMLRIWADKGYVLPRVSRQQALIGTAVDPDRLEPADLLFFTTDPGGDVITHVGMYIGKGEFIHAAMGSMKVTVNSLSGYFKQRFSHARRILPYGPASFVPKVEVKPPEPRRPATKKEAADADQLLSDVVLPNTDVKVPDYDEVRIGDTTVEDADLARQLAGVDTNDPNQFEHAGQKRPPFFSLMTDVFAGAAVPQGPRYIARDEHAVSLHTGGATFHGPSTVGAFYLSPELNLRFENVGVRLNLAFPVPWALTNGAIGFIWGTQWRDYTRVLRLAQYGEPEAALYFALDRFATTTLGHGSLVRQVSPSLQSPYLPGAEFGHVPLTWHGDVNLERASVQTSIDDVLDPRLIAGRVAVRPWMSELTLSAEYAVDLGPGRARPATNMLGSEVEYRAWRTRWHQTDVYGGTHFAIAGGATAPDLTMAKGTVGTLWRFRLGQTAAHALRFRAEIGFGRSRDTWMDNFEYIGVPRATAPLSGLVGLGYGFREFFELGATYVPALVEHKLESHLGLTNVPIDPRVRLNVQILHQMLLGATPVHYLLADVHVIAVRFFKAGVIVRKPLAANFERWDVMADLALEIPF